MVILIWAAYTAAGAMVIVWPSLLLWEYLDPYSCCNWGLWWWSWPGLWWGGRIIEIMHVQIWRLCWAGPGPYGPQDSWPCASLNTATGELAPSHTAMEEWVPTLRRAGPTPHHWPRRAGSAPCLRWAVPVTYTNQLSYPQTYILGLELAHLTSAPSVSCRSTWRDWSCGVITAGSSWMGQQDIQEEFWWETSGNGVPEALNQTHELLQRTFFRWSWLDERVNWVTHRSSWCRWDEWRAVGKMEQQGGFCLLVFCFVSK